MQQSNRYSRINLGELKGQIVKKLGPESSKQYFYYLQKFLCSKLNKVDFNKLCLRVISQENIPLHNLFIRSILRNACRAQACEVDDDLKRNAKEIPADFYHKNGLQISTNQDFGASGICNGGDLLPLSSRKARTGFRDRRNCDRLSYNGKSSFASHITCVSQLSDDSASIENGDLATLNTGMSKQLCESENENGNLISDKSKRTVVRKSSKNESKEASTGSQLQAPLELPHCPSSTGAPRKAPPPGNCRFINTFSDGALLDSLGLRERMTNIAVEQGLDGVSLECADALNLGLDSYLRGLISSCFSVVGAMSVNSHNFIEPSISLQDLRVSMELRPCQLGEDWPLLLEKIRNYASNE